MKNINAYYKSMKKLVKVLPSFRHNVIDYKNNWQHPLNVLLLQLQKQNNLKRKMQLYKHNYKIVMKKHPKHQN